ncbi:MAG: ABC transporter permease, partial [Bryobacteraceae bacterium]
LLVLLETNPARKTGLTGIAPARVEDWNRLNHSFTGIAGAYTENLTDTSGPMPEKLVCGRTSPRFFSVLGVLPLAGREISPDEERFGGPNAALISESLWRRRFASNPRVLGKSLRLGGLSYPIVGVLPASFRFPLSNESVDVWIPSALPDTVMRNRENDFYLVVGRLKPGVAPGSAEADLKAVQAGLGAEYPATDAHWIPVARSLKDATVGSSKAGLWILFAAVGLVLLIGCANVACLLLTQAHRRAREMAIRFSLGARRGQVMRQLLWESFLLALPGALLGLLLSVWGTDALRSLIADYVPRADGIRLNWQVVAFTLSLSLLTTLFFGLLPALTATRGESVAALRSRAEVGGRQTLLRTLAGLQVALARVLIIGAGLLIRSMASRASVPLGFDTHNVLTLHVSASWDEQANYPRVQHRLQRTLEAIERVPGVRSAAIALNLPGGSGSDFNLSLHVAGRKSNGPGDKILANAPVVSSSYFRTLGIPLLAGRMCRDNPDSKGPQEAMVN